MKAPLSRRSATVVLCLAAVLAGVGIGSAAIPSASGVITACHNASSTPAGQLRVIDKESGAKCAIAAYDPTYAHGSGIVYVVCASS